MAFGSDVEEVQELTDESEWWEDFANHFQIGETNDKWVVIAKKKVGERSFEC
jgi:hypothetical protein